MANSLARTSVRAEVVCQLEGCDRPMKAKGYCNRDYQRFMKHGTAVREEGKS